MDLAGILLGRDDMTRGACDRDDLSSGYREAQDHAGRKRHVHVGWCTLGIGSGVFIEQSYPIAQFPGAADGRGLGTSHFCLEIDMASGGAFDGDSSFLLREGGAPCHGVVVAHGRPAVGAWGKGCGRACHAHESGRRGRRRASCRGGINTGIALAVLFIVGVARSGLLLDAVFVSFLITGAGTGAGFFFSGRFTG